MGNQSDKPKRSWKDAAGRQEGHSGYQFGDVTRSLFHRGGGGGGAAGEGGGGGGGEHKRGPPGVPIPDPTNILAVVALFICADRAIEGVATLPVVARRRLWALLKAGWAPKQLWQQQGGPPRARAGSGERGEHRTRSAMSSRGDCSSVVRRLFRLARACMGEATARVSLHSCGFG